MTFSKDTTTGVLNAEPSLLSKCSENDLPPRSSADATFKPEQEQKHKDEGPVNSEPTVISVSEFLVWQENQPATDSDLAISHPPRHEVDREDGIYHCDCNNDPFHSQMAFHHHHTHVGRPSYPDEVLVSSYTETPGSRKAKRRSATEMEQSWENMRLKETMALGRTGHSQDKEERTKTTLA